MDTALITIPAANSISIDRAFDAEPVTAAQRLEAWLRGLGANTSRAYTRDLACFATWLGEHSLGAALDRLIKVSRARALLLVERYRDEQKEAGLSSATINRRLSAINSALRQIAKAEIGPGRLDVALVPHEPRRDTRGPGVVKVARVLEELGTCTSPLGIRDAAIVRLAAQRGLRRSEIAGLTLADLKLEDSEISVVRKGKRERQPVQLPRACVEALQAWLAVRVAPEDEAALFVTIGPASRGRPLTADLVFRIVRRHGNKIGGAWRPHGLRHTAVSAALQRTNNLEAARIFAGHANVATTQRYLDDKREMEQAAVSALEGLF